MKKEYLKSGLIFIVLVSLGVLAAVMLYFAKYFHADYFMPGVVIGGIQVEGSTVEEAESLLNKELERVYKLPVVFYHGEYEEVTTLHKLCQPVNVHGVVTSAWMDEKSRSWHEKITNLDGSRKIVYPVKLEYRPEQVSSLVEKWNRNWGVPFRDSSLEVDAQRGLIVVPGSVGLKVNTEKTFKPLPQDLKEFSGQLRIPVVMTEEHPQVDEETLSNMGEISSYTTAFNAGEINRSHNLQMAANGINGSVVAPQEVFSFNQKVGKRTLEKGYRDAMVIVGGKFEPGLGGGVCQVSSTLYNACLLAGLDIVERSNHALAIAYVPLGQDATVVYGLQDFKFRNNTGYPVYLRAVTGGGRLTINVYGKLTARQNIKVSHVVDQTIPFKTITELDPQLQPGEQKVEHAGSPGYVVRSFRTYYDVSGNVIKRQQLARDTYRPLNKVVKQGPEANTKPNPSPPVIPDPGTLPPDPEKGTEVPPMVPGDIPDTSNQVNSLNRNINKPEGF